MANLTNSPSSASTPTAASTNASHKIKYDVFLNHRGPDVKKTFVSHLYHRLRSKGFEVFLDKQEMEPGEEVKAQIKEAIETADVNVAIFSPTYAASPWCLDELVQMLELGKPIIPVFYSVDPAELRWTSDKDGVSGRILKVFGRPGKNGVYTEALRIHEKKKRCDPAKIKKWREALHKVSYIIGLELNKFDGDEGELLERVVQLVEKYVKKPQLDVAAYPTGLDGKLDEFEGTVSLARKQHSRETKVVGIVGSGGVGKTTLAKEYFKHNKSGYGKSCFLEGVRGTPLNGLQVRLIKELTSRPSGDLNICSIIDGKQEISRRLSGFKAIIVLDDIDQDDQLDALFSPLKDVLSSDSLILVTSRHKDVLLRKGEAPIYKLRGLDSKHSEMLFCLHAFHNPQPVVGYEELVANFLDVCDGLPLSLKVLGGMLYGKDMEYWQAQLGKISRTLPPDVLKISYDSLDDEEKEIFLDIACFFIKEDKDVAIRVWDTSNWAGKLNLQNLEDKGLVEIDSKNCITMHDHLRDMGRSLAAKEPLRRLWCPIENLSYNAFQPSSTRVRGINMVQQSCGQSSENPVDLGTCFAGMNGLQLLRAEGDCLGSISNLLRQSSLLWLRWDNYPDCSLSSLPMRNLRFLQVAGDNLQTLWESENEAPVQLRELHIDAANLQLPQSIGRLKHLEKIVLGCTMETLPEELFHVRSLKHLRLPTRMMRLPDSLANMTELQVLKLQCPLLEELPPSLGNLKSLRELTLHYCHKLRDLPESVGELKQLRTLMIHTAGIERLPVGVMELNELEILSVQYCPLIEIPFHRVSSQSSPDHIYKCMLRLKDLDLHGTGIKKLSFPPSCCPSLQRLNLSFCHELESVGALPTTLASLHLQECNSLEKITGLSDLARLRLLDISECNEIEDLPGVEKLMSLEELRGASHTPCEALR